MTYPWKKVHDPVLSALNNCMPPATLLYMRRLKKARQPHPACRKQPRYASAKASAKARAERVAETHILHQRNIAN